MQMLWPAAQSTDERSFSSFDPSICQFTNPNLSPSSVHHRSRSSMIVSAAAASLPPSIACKRQNTHNVTLPANCFSNSAYVILIPTCIMSYGPLSALFKHICINQNFGLKFPKFQSFQNLPIRYHFGRIFYFFNFS